MLKSLILAGVVSVGLVFASSADAGWRHHRGCQSHCGGYSACGGHHHHHRHRHVRWRGHHRGGCGGYQAYHRGCATPAYYGGGYSHGHHAYSRGYTGRTCGPTGCY